MVPKVAGKLVQILHNINLMEVVKTNLEVEDHERDGLEGVRGVSRGEAHARLLDLVGRPLAVAAEQVQVALGCVMIPILT